VLGATGRNFAAGMSGGVAYVYDPDDRLQGRCNLASVELEAVRLSRPGEEYDSGSPMADMLRHDAERLKHLIERHVALTGSRRGRDILDNWSDAVGRFVKVMPVDYRRALTELEAAAVAAE
jgi:glutamate synthase (NADPH/NADH) large chain